ncbi:diguanylate cyclase domain-containing protein [Phyllobacterium phragmitis]|uniref:diguanylate cyclase n=1 Tax=Phyllobacterium phragmitis TaxID=2670329 RepID=A0ABQ0GZB1_9HYPH
MITHTSHNDLFAEEGEAGEKRLLRIEAIYDRVPVGLCFVNRAGIVLTANDCLCEIFGGEIKGIDRTRIEGSRIDSLLPEDVLPLDELLALADREAVLPDREIWCPRSGRCHLVSAAPIPNDLGEIAGLSLVFVDITDKKRIAATLDQSELRADYALESAGQWLWDYNIVENRVWRSPQYYRILGREHEAQGYREGWDIVHPDDKPRVIADFKEVVSGRKETFESIYRVPKDDGSDLWILSRGKIVEYAADGAPLRLLATSVDITAQKRAEDELLRTIRNQAELERQLLESNRRLRELSESDPLTGLPNRRKFDALLADEFARALTEGHPLTVMMIDVDHFKAFNDLYGHLEGDACLCRIAAAIRQTLESSGEFVARYGGEEFAVIARNVDQESAERLAGRILSATRSCELDHAGSPYGKISVSIGYSVLTEVTHALANAGDLLKLADKALYRSKRQGRNTICCELP